VAAALAVSGFSVTERRVDGDWVSLLAERGA
jgi:hypothetical protein